MWQIKNIISSLLLSLFGMVMTYYKSREKTPIHNVPFTFKHELKLLNLLYYNAYCHQTCWDGDIPLGAPTHRVT